MTLSRLNGQIILLRIGRWNPHILSASYAHPEDRHFSADRSFTTTALSDD